jgi:hypothetical protein
VPGIEKIARRLDGQGFGAVEPSCGAVRARHGKRPFGTLLVQRSTNLAPAHRENRP